MNGYGWSKTPLKLLLILALACVFNACLVLGIQMVTNYRIEAPIDIALLSRLDESLIDGEIQDHREIQPANLHVYLVKRPDGSARFVTLQKHALLDRYRFLEKACQDAPENGEEVWLRAGVSQFEVHISDSTYNGLMRIGHNGTGPTQSARQQFSNLILFSNLGLCALELAVWCLIFRKEEIA